LWGRPLCNMAAPICPSDQSASRICCRVKSRGVCA
jgi:hypothetical protein